jgi:hypothetical protein
MANPQWTAPEDWGDERWENNEGRGFRASAVVGGKLYSQFAWTLSGAVQKRDADIARDSDASLAENAKRLSPEGVAARAVGIAQTPPVLSHD